MSKKPLSLFEGFGIELEYMIVDRDNLMPKFICDKVLEKIAGHKTMHIEDGLIAWSNELALHVIELKCNGPQNDLDAVSKKMHSAIKDMNLTLEAYNAQLLPTAMHPLFNPNDGTLELWSGEDIEIYDTYNRIFGCSGHGWGNLQSIHINLPFANDEEFYLLHSAIRMILPLLPAFAASSPLVEGKWGPLLDSRLHFYLENQRRIPSILGDAIPEAVRNKSEYENLILKPMYRDIQHLDPDGILSHEWLNSRAAIARFERNAIEIRILDIQECVKSDFILINAIIAAIKHLVKKAQPDRQIQVTQNSLQNILYGVLQHQGNYFIDDQLYLDCIGASNNNVKNVFTCLLDQSDLPFHFNENNLAQRIKTKLGEHIDRETILKEYKVLAKCLDENCIYE